jgi:hypothetical protein
MFFLRNIFLAFVVIFSQKRLIILFTAGRQNMSFEKILKSLNKNMRLETRTKL